MKKSIIITCMAIAPTTVALSQDTYFQTGFDEGIPSTFTLHDMDERTPSTDMQKLGFAVGTPWITTTEGTDSNKVACSTSWYKNAGQSDDWMITGAIEVKSAKAMLTWRARASDREYRDGYKVYISEKGTAIEDFDKSKSLFATPKENYQWTARDASLADYVGKTVYIAFVNDSKDKTCLYIDDIFVGVPSAVKFSLDLPRVIRHYGEVTLSGQAFASEGKNVTGYTIGYAIGDNSCEQKFYGTLTADKKVDFTMDRKFHIDRNQTLNYKAWIKSGTDSVGVSGRVSAYPWKLVSEEVTGTWCGYCVRGLVAMKTMNAKYPDSFIGIALHNSSTSWIDAMAAGVEDYHDRLYSSCKISGYPHSVYNRNPMLSIDPGNMEQYHDAILKTYTNNCGVELNATYDESTGKINAQTDVYFAQQMEKADYKLAYVVVENNVHRTHEDLGIEEGKPTGYEQSNYYANGATGEMGGFENLPNPVPAEQMWYNDVARAIYPDYDGISGIIPATIAEGDHFTHQYTLELTSNVLNKENTELIVLLLDKNGIIANADKVAIKGLTNGIATVKASPTKGNDIYYNLNGQRVDHPSKGIFIHNGRKIVLP